MRNRDYHKKYAIKHASRSNWEKFQLLRNAKSKYFSDKITDCSVMNDPKKTWKLINSLLGKNSKSTNINEFLIDGMSISDRKSIGPYGNFTYNFTCDNFTCEINMWNWNTSHVKFSYVKCISYVKFSYVKSISHIIPHVKSKYVELEHFTCEILICEIYFTCEINSCTKSEIRNRKVVSKHI